MPPLGITSNREFRLSVGRSCNPRHFFNLMGESPSFLGEEPLRFVAQKARNREEGLGNGGGTTNANRHAIASERRVTSLPTLHGRGRPCPH